MKRILLIEPHPDDICLGFFYSIKREKADYHLVSVSSHNGRNSKRFCEEMDIKWHSTKLVDDIPYQERRISPREIKKQKDSFLYQRMYYLQQHEERYLEIEELITKAIEKIPCETVVTTLGILHPIHVLVSIACEMIAKQQNKELIYFADFPYASRKFGEKIIKDSGMKCSLVHNKSLEVRKDKLLEEYYPTETNILRWDRGVISDNPEMIFQKEEERKKRYIFIDGGADKGSTIGWFERSQFYSKHSWEMFAFEADSQLASAIPHKSNLTIFDQAMWIHDDFIEFHLAKDWKWNSVFGRKTRGLPDKTVCVSSIDFSHWVKNNFNESDYILLKLDIEGAEYKILDKMILDGSLDYVDSLFIEFHSGRAGVSVETDKKIVEEFEKRGISYQVNGRFSSFLKRFDEELNGKKDKRITINKKIEISVLSCGGEYMTGAHAHAIRTIEALQRVGVEAKLVEADDIGDPDILFFDSIGISLENKSNIEGNKKRLEEIEKYMGKIPFVLVRHSISEHSVFKRSFEYFVDFVWDLIVSTGKSDGILSLIKEENKFKKLVSIDYPFDFDDKHFENKSKYANTISAPARIASCKRTHLILDVAEILHGKKKFLIAGYEGGLYWYRQIKEHPNRKYVEFIGGYKDFTFPYENSAFAIDLTYLQRYGRVQQCKQYVFLESISCGNIPILFDFWRYDGGFEAVWLPSPKKEGRSIVFNVKEYAEIIRDFKYDFDMAVENKRLLKKELSVEKIGNQYKDEFNKLLGGDE